MFIKLLACANKDYYYYYYFENTLRLMKINLKRFYLFINEITMTVCTQFTEKKSLISKKHRKQRIDFPLSCSKHKIIFSILI